MSIFAIAVQFNCQVVVHWSPAISYWPLIGSRAPRMWKCLLLRIREYQSLPAFKRHLKTHFSSYLYIIPSDPSRTHPDSLMDIGAKFFYLLTYYFLLACLQRRNSKKKSAI